MNPKQFLQIGGIVLVLVGILGFFLIGPDEISSVFGSAWWFDSGENWAHLVLGIVALILGFGVKNESLQKNVTILVGVLGLFFAVYNVFSTNFLGANLESPLDLILHLVVGAWALWAGLRTASPAMGGSSMPR